MNVLIIGLGSIGKKHVNAIKTIDKTIKIYALRSSKEATNYLDVQNIFDLKEIETLSIDFVIISNPTSEHKQTIASLVKYKLPLFIEKPLTFKLDIKEIIEEVNRNVIKTYVACNLRFLDCLKYVKERLSTTPSLRINEVNIYCGSYLPDWRKEGDFRKSYSANAVLGGGVHIDLIHEIDYLYWLFGKPKNSFRHFRQNSSLQINAIDYANYILDYEQFTVNIVLNYYRRDSKRALEIVTEESTWNVDLLQNSVTINNQEVYSSTQTILDTYQQQIEYFIKNIDREGVLNNSINEAYQVLQICLEK